MAMLGPRKRPRLSIFDNVHDAKLAEKRHRNDMFLKSRFEAIFEKYEKDFAGVGDEVDLTTGRIIVDNGHLASMTGEKDPGRPSTASTSRSNTPTAQKHIANGRSMLRAMTEAPDREAPYFNTHVANDVIHSIETIAENAGWSDQEESEMGGDNEQDDESKDVSEEESEDELFNIMPVSTRRRPPLLKGRNDQSPASRDVSLSTRETESRESSSDMLFEASTSRTSLSSDVLSTSHQSPAHPEGDANLEGKAIMARFGDTLGSQILDFLEQRRNSQLDVEPAWRIPVDIGQQAGPQASPPASKQTSHHLARSLLRPVETASPDQGKSIWATKRYRRKPAEMQHDRYVRRVRAESEDPLQGDFASPEATGGESSEEDAMQSDDEDDVLHSDAADSVLQDDYGHNEVSEDELFACEGPRLLSDWEAFGTEQNPNKNPIYSVKRPEICPICNKGYSSYVGMIMHLAHTRTGIQDGKYVEDEHKLEFLNALFEDGRKDPKFYLVARRGACPYCDAEYKSYQGVMGHLARFAQSYRRGELQEPDEDHPPEVLARLNFVVTPGAEDPPKHNIQQYIFRHKLEVMMRKYVEHQNEHDAGTGPDLATERAAGQRESQSLAPQAPVTASPLVQAASGQQSKSTTGEGTPCQYPSPSELPIDPAILQPWSRQQSLSTTEEDDAELRGNTVEFAARSPSPPHRPDAAPSEEPEETERPASSYMDAGFDHSALDQTIPQTEAEGAERSQAEVEQEQNVFRYDRDDFEAAQQMLPEEFRMRKKDKKRPTEFEDEFRITDFRKVVELHEGAGLRFNNILPFLSSAWQTRSGKTLYYRYRDFRHFQQSGGKGALNPVAWKPEDEALLQELAENPEGTMEGLQRQFRRKRAKAIGDKLAETWLPYIREQVGSRAQSVDGTDADAVDAALPIDPALTAADVETAEIPSELMPEARLRDPDETETDEDLELSS